MRSQEFVLAAGHDQSEWLRRLRMELPKSTGARDALDRALAGCPASAVLAVQLASGQALYGAVCLALYSGNVHPDVLREALDALWGPENTYRQIKAAWQAAGVAKLDLLRRAAYPTHLLPESFTVWRYAGPIADYALSAGRSWSTYLAPIALTATLQSALTRQPHFVGRRTIHRDSVVMYRPRRIALIESHDEIVFDAADGGELEDTAAIEDLAAEFRAMLADKRMYHAIMCYYGGPGLPVWGAPAWRVEALDLMAKLRRDQLSRRPATSSWGLATDGATATHVAMLGDPFTFSPHDPAGSWLRS